MSEAKDQVFIDLVLKALVEKIPREKLIEIFSTACAPEGSEVPSCPPPDWELPPAPRSIFRAVVTGMKTQVSPMGTRLLVITAATGGATHRVHVEDECYQARMQKFLRVGSEVIINGSLDYFVWTPRGKCSPIRVAFIRASEIKVLSNPPDACCKCGCS